MSLRLTSNFVLSEFVCKCGCTPAPAALCGIKALARNLQVLRTHTGLPIQVNSGYRCKTHNAAVGGSKASLHISGLAADIQIKGLTGDEVQTIIEGLIKEGRMSEGGIGRYKGSRMHMVHYDCRGTRARWWK
jgi:uncharacterized protein YcbK (DUF882 family)